MLSPFAFIAPVAAILADQTKFTPVGDFRARFERRLDRDLSSANDDNRSAFETRLRVGFDFKDRTDVTGKFRYIHAYTEAWAPARNGSDESSDVYMAYVDVKRPEGTWSIGRQPLKFGGSRILDESNFGQRLKSYDIVRFKTANVDVFAGKIGLGANRNDQARLVGGVLRSPLGESMALFKSAKTVTDADFWTFDHRYTNTFTKGDYAIEAALQTGRNAGKEVEAWWVHGRLNYDLSKSTRLYGEFNAASGGTSATKFRRFDARYGNPHTAYGLLDLQVLSNLVQWEVGASCKPTKRSEYAISYNRYALQDPTDGWYGGTSINGRPGGQFVDPTGNSGRDVGGELNLMGRWDLSRFDSLQFECGIFFPGSFVRSFNGAATRNQVWGLLTYVRKF